MSSSKVNKIKIEGNSNISVQDIYDSSVVINTSNFDEVRELIDDLQKLYEGQANNCINIFVLTTNQTQINEMYEEFTEFKIPKDNYGFHAHDWMPFCGEKSLSKLLIEYSKLSGFKIEAYFIDNCLPTDDMVLATLIDDIIPNTILIADSLSLDFENNREFARLFDDSSIGGCIIPVCNHHPQNLKYYLKQRQRQVFRHLNTCFYKRFGKDYIYIEPEVVTKYELFRRLTNIATQHLGIQPVPNVSWRKRFLEGRSNDSISALKSSI